VLRESLLAPVTSIMGIVMAHQLHPFRMTDEKISFSEALAQAQARVCGIGSEHGCERRDAAQKIGLLASLAFGCWMEQRDILCEGYPGDTQGHRVLRLRGFAVKLVAQAGS